MPTLENAEDELMYEIKANQQTTLLQAPPSLILFLFHYFFLLQLNFAISGVSKQDPGLNCSKEHHSCQHHRQTEK